MSCLGAQETKDQIPEILSPLAYNEALNYMHKNRPEDWTIDWKNLSQDQRDNIGQWATILCDEDHAFGKLITTGAPALLEQMFSPEKE